MSYLQVPWDDFREAAGDEYHDMYRWFADVGYDVNIPTLRRTHPGLLSLEDYLREAGWEGAEPGAG